MSQVADGNTVRVHYTGTLADGTQFDSSVGRDPLEVTVGAGQVIPGFDNALVGMAAGDQKSVDIEPNDGYGPHLPELVYAVERERIPPDVELQAGTTLQASNEAGEHIRLTVIELNDEKVTLDANHPLAGKTLTFALELVEIVA